MAAHIMPADEIYVLNRLTTLRHFVDPPAKRHLLALVAAWRPIDDEWPELSDSLHGQSMTSTEMFRVASRQFHLRPETAHSMISLIQRVTEARVVVDDVTVGAIGPGILALIAVERGDGAAQAQRMLERIEGYRIFSDDLGRMNRSLLDIGGDLLLVSQFTLAADTQKGMRPSFTPAASPEEGLRWFNYLTEIAATRHPRLATGRFGAHMKVHLINDGPVTFWLNAI